MDRQQKILAVVMAILLVAIVGSFIFIKIRTTPPADNNSTGLVGNDSDEHGCVASAGYMWCEQKQKCLRVFEEFCGDAVAAIVADIKDNTGVELGAPEETEFNWIVGRDDTIADATIAGLMYSADSVKMADYDKVEKYLNDTFGLEKYNIADGVVGGLRGYYAGYMACQLNFRHKEMTQSPDSPSEPVGDSLKVTLACGFFNQNDIDRIIVGQKIKEILAAKYKKAISEVAVEILRSDDGHATGRVSFSQEEGAEGGMFLAVKSGETWQVVYDGNGSIDCELMKQNYQFSDELLRPEFCD